ncbi:MAG: hypothetical protein QXK76_02745 [Candidatus Woesearchaeota archaeon]
MNPGDYLKDVSENNYFRLSDGRIIRNIEELLSILKSSDDALFYQHVNQYRNDFAEWIKHCINYIDLYNKLVIIKDKNSFVNILEQEIAFLKNPKISETMKFFSEDYSNGTTQTGFEKNSPGVSEEKKVMNNLSTGNVVYNNVSNSDNNLGGGKSMNNSVDSNISDVILDFESFLGDVVKEINEEIFFL